MRKKLIVWSCKLASLGSLIWLLIYLYWKFSKKIVVEETQNSMPILIILLISVLGIMLILWLFAQLKAYMKEKPFGFASLYFIIVLFGAISITTLMFINKVMDLVNNNVERFLSDLSIYKGSMHIVLAILAVGLLFNTLGIVLDKTLD